MEFRIRALTPDSPSQRQALLERNNHWISRLTHLFAVRNHRIPPFHRGVQVETNSSTA